MRLLTDQCQYQIILAYVAELMLQMPHCFGAFLLFFLSLKSLLLQKLPSSRESNGLVPGGDSVHLLITLNEYSSDVGKPLYWVGVSSKFP